MPGGDFRAHLILQSPVSVAKLTRSISIRVKCIASKLGGAFDQNVQRMEREAVWKFRVVENGERVPLERELNNAVQTIVRGMMGVGGPQGYMFALMNPMMKGRYIVGHCALRENGGLPAVLEEINQKIEPYFPPMSILCSFVSLDRKQDHRILIDEFRVTPDINEILMQVNPDVLCYYMERGLADRTMVTDRFMFFNTVYRMKDGCTYSSKALTNMDPTKVFPGLNVVGIWDAKHTHDYIYVTIETGTPTTPQCMHVALKRFESTPECGFICQNVGMMCMDGELAVVGNKTVEEAFNDVAYQIYQNHLPRGKWVKKEIRMGREVPVATLSNYRAPLRPAAVPSTAQEVELYMLRHEKAKITGLLKDNSKLEQMIIDHSRLTKNVENLVKERDQCKAEADSMQDGLVREQVFTAQLQLEVQNANRELNQLRGSGTVRELNSAKRKIEELRQEKHDLEMSNHDLRGLLADKETSLTNVQSTCTNMHREIR